ncbi:MAG TPA: aminodeoxychorismate/anthranilate synthase component II, partial [Chloroflexota bacterium]|nr:aminodeoxychorismate/anthranilate synthase component II [Chloroflexota bacterium]
MILLVDNYDSFTYNLYQLLCVLGARVEVKRNDQIAPADLAGIDPRGVVISPGPGSPDGAGVSRDLLMEAARERPATPVLGVCLGHQCVGAAFGARVVRADRLMHGKISRVYHDGMGVFAGVPSPFDAVRYHSLVVDRASLPECLVVTAEADDGSVMGLRHRELPVEGVQFHPESVLTREGPRI